MGTPRHVMIVGFVKIFSSVSSSHQVQVLLAVIVVRVARLVRNKSEAIVREERTADPCLHTYANPIHPTNFALFYCTVRNEKSWHWQ